jgi:hypothetical protein
MSLSDLFEKMTFNLDDIIVKVAVKTGVKLKNTNYTIFVFSQDHQNFANGEIIILTFCILFFNVNMNKAGTTVVKDYIAFCYRP